jgi:hypothetical protein
MMLHHAAAEPKIQKRSDRGILRYQIVIVGAARFGLTWIIDDHFGRPKDFFATAITALTRPARLASGDFDFDLFRLGLFALGQMDL